MANYRSVSDEKYQNFISNMKEIRKFKVLTQKDIARGTGISSSSIGFYENFERECGLTTALKIAEFFETSIDEMCKEPKEMYDPTTIHGRLKGLRISRGFTVREIADELGVAASCWSYLENGKKLLKVDLCSKIAKFFGVSTDYIIHGKTEEEQNV